MKVMIIPVVSGDIVKQLTNILGRNSWF